MRQGFAKTAWGLVALIAIGLMACEKDKVNGKNANGKTSMDAMNELQINDPHSFAKPSVALATHLDLDIVVDFEQQRISGTATYQINRKDSGNVVIFDTKNLDIIDVTSPEDTSIGFNLGENDPILGRALEIQLKPGVKTVKIQYATKASAAALQWLSPQQTFGKQHPFLFTQSQAILARTWLPCQDGPGMRFTYNATVKVPSELLAVMSATNPVERNPEGIYHFEMKQPIPAYLMALAVGD